MGAIFRRRKCYTGKVKDRSQYSTDEQFTGEYWIDGKPLYRKVYEVTTPSSTGTATILETIGNEKTVIKVEGSIVLTNASIPINFYQSSSVYSDAFTGNGNLYMTIGPSTYAGKSAVIILEYTKTTD